MQTLTPVQRLVDARAVVLGETGVLDFQQRRAAWSILMRAKGYRVDQRKLEAINREVQIRLARIHAEQFRVSSFAGMSK